MIGRLKSLITTLTSSGDKDVKPARVVRPQGYISPEDLADLSHDDLISSMHLRCLASFKLKFRFHDQKADVLRTVGKNKRVHSGWMLQPVISDLHVPIFQFDTDFKTMVENHLEKAFFIEGNSRSKAKRVFNTELRQLSQVTEVYLFSTSPKSNEADVFHSYHLGKKI